MATPEFPSLFDLGTTPHDRLYVLRRRQLVLAFEVDLDAELIARVLSDYTVTPHDPDGAPGNMIERLRSQRMLWVDVPPGVPVRQLAKTIQAAEAECWLASPVYVPRLQPFDENAAAPIPFDFIVRLREGDDTTWQDIEEKYGLRCDRDWSELVAPLLRFRIGESLVPDDGFDLIRLIEEGIAGVRVEFDWLKLDPLEADYRTKQWNLGPLDMGQAWTRTRGDTTFTVAVIDTGFDLNHPDLKPAFDTTYQRFFGLTGQSPDASIPAAVPAGTATSTGPTTSDSRWHGTAVAGVIAAPGAAAIDGIAGDCKIMPLRIDPMSTANIAAAIEWATAHFARVVNLSISAPPGEAIDVAVSHAWIKNVVICAAAGNASLEGRGEVEFPAAYTRVIAVGATDRDDVEKGLHPNVGTEENWYSQRGAELDILAPGIEIPTVDAAGMTAGYNAGAGFVEWYGKSYLPGVAGDAAGNYLFVFTGTSAATAQVSGVVALLFARWGLGLTGAEATALIKTTGDKVNSFLSTRRVNAGNALTAPKP